MDFKTIEDGKTMAAVAYLTIIGAVIALINNSEKKNPFTAFHVRQGLGLCLTFMMMGYFIGYFNNMMITIAFWIGFSVLFLFGLIGATSGKMQQVPLLGAFYQKLFSNIGN